MMNHYATGLLVLLLLVACSSGVAEPAESTPSPTAARSAAEGVYTVEQAERGQEVFDRVCSVCHSNSEFSGRMFEITWMAAPVGDLFQHIRAAMPQDDPGSLTPEEYAAVVAHFLRVNGRPAGDRELPADVEALRGLRW